MNVLLDYFNKTINAKYIEIVKTDTEYCISRIDDNTIMIDFEGSLSEKDWIQNFKISKKSFCANHKKFKVHQGFLEKWLSVKEIIINYIKENNVKKVILKGFSQGGAVALIAYIDLKYIYSTINFKAIVFGCPRVFSVLTSKRDFKNVYQYELSNDIVPRIPPWLFFYKHCGKRIKLNKLPWYKKIFSTWKVHFPKFYKDGIEEYIIKC